MGANVVEYVQVTEVEKIKQIGVDLSNERVNLYTWCIYTTGENPMYGFSIGFESVTGRPPVTLNYYPDPTFDPVTSIPPANVVCSTVNINEAIQNLAYIKDKRNGKEVIN